MYVHAAIIKDNINVCRICHNLTTTSQSKKLFVKYANKQNTNTLITIENNHSVNALIGSDNVFRIRLIGELNIRNISQSIKNIPTKPIISLPENVCNTLISIPN